MTCFLTQIFRKVLMEKTIINNEENRKKLALNCVFSLLFSLSFMPVCKAYGLSDAMCVLFTGVLFIIGLILIEVFFKIYEKLSIKVTPPSKQISLKVAFGIYVCCALGFHFSRVLSRMCVN